MNELQIFNSLEFGQVRTIVKDNEVWFVGRDIAEALGYSDTKSALIDHVDIEDKNIFKSGDLPPLNFVIPNRGMTFINESGLYSLVLSSKLPNAKKFKRWITKEVIPSIRKHGGYLTPAKIEEVLSNPDTIIKLATELKKLRTENQMQAQQIAEFKPIKEYVDLILQSDGTVTTTQIAADYGLSAKKLNKILNEEKIQHKVNEQWGDCIIKIGSIEQDVDFPISFKSYGFCSVGILQESSDTVIIKYMDKHTTASTIRFRLSQVSSGVDTWIKFLSIGK